MFRLRLVWTLAAPILAGCAALLPPAPTDWSSVRLERQALSSWNLSGRAAVSAAEQGWTAALDWRQHGTQSELRLYGPFGVGALRVTTDGESLDIETSKGEILAGEAARTLLENTLGTTLPLRPLRYWLLGVPEPVLPALAQLDGDGRLAQLQQAGWQVTYHHYDHFEDGWLPSRLSFKQGEVKLKMAIDRWSLGR